jgi:stress-induced-phosphoprotein 1
MHVPSPPSSPAQQPKSQTAGPAAPEPVPARGSSEKAAADGEKNKGNAAYKSRSFDQAIAHYQKAWDLYKDITYLNNLSAAYFEKGDYEKSIAEATRAVEEGREIRADFKLIAKYVWPFILRIG